jgi:hypothetical protein
LKAYIGSLWVSFPGPHCTAVIFYGVMILLGLLQGAIQVSRYNAAALKGMKLLEVGG